MTRRLSCLSLSAIFTLVLAVPFTPAADVPLSQGAKITFEKKLRVKLKLDIDKKMLRPLIGDDIPAAVKEATGLTQKIEIATGQGVTLTSSFGPFKGEMTLEEVLNKICEDKSWGWYVNNAPKGDQKDGAIFLTTNSKEKGYKEGTGPKEVAKKDDPKEKPKDEPKTGDGDKAAAEMLTKAKFQMNTKQTEKAMVTLKEIIEKYPDTKAAADAKKLLEKIGK
ncbi:MAG: hypothetical protein EXS09_08865 [Gemmataceae bacterium]|nr:hypothetical protein [Gemmataceae bacterium]